MIMAGVSTDKTNRVLWLQLTFLVFSRDIYIAGDIIVIDINSNQTEASFNDATASFGPDFPDGGLIGRLVPADPLDGCTPLQPPPPSNGSDVWIALMVRSSNCSFVQKVKNAQTANYSAAIVYNNNSDDIFRMNGDGKNIHIPSTFVGNEDGLNLKTKYNYKHKDIVIQITEDDGPPLEFMVWPFVLVVGICFLIGLVYLIIKLCRDHIKKQVNRLSSKHLKKIPVRKFKKGDYYDTCAICLDEYEEGEKIRVLPCDHVYHTKCIDPWLTKNKKTCPVCKRRVIPGRNADSDSSDSDDGGTARASGSENTPLLQGNTNRQYAARGQRRFPPRTGPPSSTDSNENLLAAQSEEPQSQAEEPVESGIVGDTGAVGGTGTSDGNIEARILDSVEKRRDRKRKRTDRERLVQRGEESRGSEEGGFGATVDETREERRERRRIKKELKKASKRQQVPPSGEEGASSQASGSEEAHSGEATAELSVQVTGQESRAPSVKGKYRELNEVV